MEIIYFHSVPLKGVLRIGLVAGPPDPPKVSVYDGLGKTLDVLKIATLTITIVGCGLMEGRAYLSACDRKVGVCRTKKKRKMNQCFEVRRKENGPELSILFHLTPL